LEFLTKIKKPFFISLTYNKANHSFKEVKKMGTVLIIVGVLSMITSFVLMYLDVSHAKRYFLITIGCFIGGFVLCVFGLQLNENQTKTAYGEKQNRDCNVYEHIQTVNTSIL